VSTKTSSFLKLTVLLGLCLGMAEGLLAQPLLNVTIAGKLGPILGGSGGVVSGNYTSGITATGAAGQTCVLDITGTGGSGATATVELTGTNTIAPGTILVVTAPGKGYSQTSPPTAATVATGSATSCTGSAVITTKVDDPLNLNGVAFTATTSLDPVGVTFNPTQIVYNGLSFTFTAGPLQVPCSNATATFTIKDSTDNGLDTLGVTNCTLKSLITAAFQAKVGFAAGTIPAPLPLPFTAALIASPDTDSQGTYTVESGGLVGVSTTLGITGTVTNVCPSTGANACPAETLTPSSLQPFTAPQGSTTPLSQTITVGTAGVALPYAATVSGGSWLSVNNLPTTGGTTGGSSGSFAVDVNPTGLSAGTYNGTVSVWTSASNTQPQTESVTLTVTSVVTPTLSTNPTSVSLTYTQGSSPSSSLLVNSSGSAISYTAAATTVSGGNWLAVSPGSSTTPGSETVSIVTSVASTLGAGAYSGHVVLTCVPTTACSNTGGTLSVPVTLTVAAAPVLSANPTSISLTYTQGSSPSTSLLVSSSGSAISYSAAATTSSGGNWLSVSPGSGTTPGTETVSIVTSVASTLGAGSYSGSVVLTCVPTTACSNTGGALTVPVTLTVAAAPSLVPNPTSISLTYTPGSTPSTSLGLTSSNGTAISYNASVTTSSGGSWLQVSPSSGATPGSENVSIVTSVASTLAAGSYNGDVVLTCVPTTACSNTGGTLSVPVTLTVVVPPSMIANPTSISLTYTQGSSPSTSLGITSSNGTAISYTAAATTSNGGNWLAVSPSTSTTPGTETVSVVTSVASTLGAGSYSGTVTVSCTPSTSCSNTGGKLTVPVSLTVVAQPSLVASPTSISLSYTPGSSPSTPLGISSTGAAISYTAAASTSTGGNWLQVSPSSGTTPGTETVSVVTSVAGSLASGTYSGSVVVTCSPASSCSNTNGILTVPVTLTVTAATLSVSPTALTYSYTLLSGTNPSSQTVAVSASGGATIPFTASATTNSGGSWLSVSPTSGNTPGTLTVSVNPAGLAAGTYTGSIMVSSTQAPGSSPTVGVTFTVSSAPNLVPSSNSFTFAYQTGGTAPTAQPLTVGSGGAALTFTAAASTSSGGQWLAVTSPTGPTPQALSVSTVQSVLSTLAAGTYNGTITLTSAQAGNSPLSIGVTLTVSTQPSLTTVPSSLSFTYTVNGTVPGSQSVAIGNTGNGTLSGLTTTPSVPWVSISLSGSTTPATMTVLLVSSALSSLTPNTYNGTITINATGAAAALTYPVTLTVSGQPTISVSPTSLTFAGQVGAANPTAQTLTVNSTGGTVNFTAAAATTSGGNWLSVTPASGATDSTVQVSAKTTGLAAGTYNGSITVTATTSGVAGSPIVVPVTFTVAGNNLIANPPSLTFSYQLGGTAPATQTLNIASNIPGLSFTAVPGASWLSLSAGSGTTPQALGVSIVTTGLAVGTLNTNITVTSAGAGNSPFTIPVTLNVTSGVPLTANPTSLTFAYTLGGTTPAGQTVLIAAGSTGVSFTTSATTTSGGNWLAVSPSSGTTPASITVSLQNLGSLAQGTYNGTVTATAAGSNTVTIPVTLTVGTAPLTSNPTSLSFSYTTGGSTPASQAVLIAAGSAAVNFTTSAATTSGGAWLAVSPSSGTTPGSITVSVQNLGSLAQGTYTGTVTVTASGSNTVTIPVTLTVGTTPPLTASPTSLSFSFTTGGSTPASQAVLIAAGSTAVSFTTSAATTSGGAWLAVSPSSGTTPGSITVSVQNLGSLAQGTYTGTVTVTASGSNTVTIPVTLKVGTTPPLTATPTSLSFAYTPGGSTPASQPVLIAAGSTAVSFTTSAATTSGGNWLAVSPASGTTPASISVSLQNLGSLTQGTYSGTVTVTGSNTVTIPVTLTVGAEPSLTVSASTLSFSYTTGAGAPTPASIQVSTSNGASAAFAVSAVTSGGGNWLSVSPTSGTSPASFSVVVQPASLTAGTYNGTITVSASGYNSATVAVTLVVTQPKAVIQISGNYLFVLANTSAPASNTLAISASDGSAQAFTIALGASQYNWLTVSPTSGTTPANVVLTANPAGLLPGNYLVPVTVTMPGLPITTKTFNAQLTITGSNILASPSTLSFTVQPGVTTPAQTVSLTTASGTGTVALASVSTDVSWLKVTPATSVPATLSVSVVPGGLGAGTYTGYVLVKGVGSPDTSLQIPVTITVSSVPILTATPATLAFSYQTGGTAPAAQTFMVATGNTPLSFTVTSPGPWLQVSPMSGTTPATVTVTANPTGLAPGTYGGNITVNATGSSGSATVAVTLIVSGPPAITVTPSALSFTSPAGGPAPAPQTLTLTGTNAPLGFTAMAGTYWLSVTPTSGTTPATLAVSVNPKGLAAGTYTGSINITQTGAAAPQMILVTLQVGNGVALPGIVGIINAASGAVGTVAPGLAISIFGTGLGPATPAGFVLPPTGGTIATTLGGTQVLFDGTPAPVLYASPTQVNALVPFELAGKASTVLTVSYGGATTPGMTLPVMAAEPGIFTDDLSGKGQGAILNQDGSINSASNPAAPGSTIQIFGTGGGVTIPPSVDGALNPLSSTGTLALATTATVNNESAFVYYYGPAPNLISGIIQINVTLPADTPSGNVPLFVTVGSANSQTVTVAVQ